MVTLVEKMSPLLSNINSGLTKFMCTEQLQRNPAVTMHHTCDPDVV